MVEKRASNLMKLAEESEKLNAELKAMSERLRLAEERANAAAARRKRDGDKKDSSSSSSYSSAASESNNPASA